MRPETLRNGCPFRTVLLYFQPIAGQLCESSLWFLAQIRQGYRGCFAGVVGWFSSSLPLTRWTLAELTQLLPWSEPKEFLQARHISSVWSRLCSASRISFFLNLVSAVPLILSLKISTGVVTSKTHSERYGEEQLRINQRIRQAFVVVNWNLETISLKRNIPA